EVPEGVRELPAELAGVQLVRVAAEQQLVTPVQPGQQGDQLLVGPEDVLADVGRLALGTAHPAALAHLPDELARANAARFEVVFELPVEHGGQDRFRAQLTQLGESVRRPPVVEEADDLAEVENDSLHHYW